MVSNDENAQPEGGGFSWNPFRSPFGTVKPIWQGAPPPPAWTQPKPEDTVIPDESVPPHPGITPQTEGGLDSATGTALQYGGIDAAFPLLPRVQSPGVGVYGTKYEDVGGAEGQDIFNNAFVESPKRYAEASRSEADLIGQKGDQTAKVLDNIAFDQQSRFAAMQAQRAQDAEVIAQKQAAIDRATKYYSDDLANTGKFWQSPGNIFASIGAAFVGFGARNPEVGMNLINRAVEQDWAKRRQLADMHLGELRSNLANYRQLAGDKQAGDMLAMSESYRVMSNEIARIGAQMQGPLAKAQSEKLIAATQQQSDLLRMQAFQKMILQQPAFVQPGMAKLLKEGGYQPFGSATGQSPAQPGTGGKGATYSGVVGTGTASGGVSAAGGQAGQPDFSKLIGRIPDDQKAIFNKRAPGSGEELEAARLMEAKRNWVRANGNTQKFNELQTQSEKDAKEDVPKVAAAIAQADLPVRIQVVRRLTDDVKNLQIIANRMGLKPDDLLGSGSESIFGPGFMAKYRDTMEVLMGSDVDHADSHRREMANAIASAERLKQAAAGLKVVYRHEASGTAVSPREENNISQAIRSGYRGLTNFIENESQAAQADYSNALRTAKSPITGVLVRINHGLQIPTLDTTGVAGPPEIKHEGAAQEAIQKAGNRKVMVQRAVENVKKKDSQK